MKFSIITPVYNSSRYLDKCLNSILKQSFQDWELIVIDDGSTDNSYELITKFSNIDSRVKAFTQFNQGPGKTRNNGINVSKGEYIIFLDSDDFIDRDYLTFAAKKLEKSDLDILFIDVKQVDTEYKIIKYENISKYRNLNKEQLIRYQTTGKIPWGGVRKIVSSKFIKENNIQFSDYDIGEEAIFSFNLIYFSEKYDFLLGGFYNYVNHPNSQSKKKDYDPWQNVYFGIKTNLNKLDQEDNYINTLNSLGITSLVISVFRISQHESLVNSIKGVYSKFVNDERMYLRGFDMESLDLKVKLLIPFYNIYLIWVIVIISKLFNSIKSTKL